MQLAMNCPYEGLVRSHWMTLENASTGFVVQNAAKLVNL